MRADAYPLDTVLGERQQWVVPVYQRHYEWETDEDKQLPKLWADLEDETVDRLEGRNPLPHYFGAIIFPNRRIRELERGNSLLPVQKVSSPHGTEGPDLTRRTIDDRPRSRSLATALLRARFASDYVTSSYTTSWDTTGWQDVGVGTLKHLDCHFALRSTLGGAPMAPHFPARMISRDT